MCITIITNGSRGDVQPFVALANGLRKAGFKTRLVAPPIFRDLAQTLSIDFFPLGNNPIELDSRPEVVSRLESGGQLRFGWLRIREKQYEFADVAEETRLVCQDAEAVIYRGGSYLTYAIVSIANKMKIPCFQADLIPLHRTKNFPSLYFGIWPKISKKGNLLSHALFEQVTWQSFRSPVNSFRKRQLGIKPLSLFSPGTNELPVLCGFSPKVIERPQDWPDHVYITGFWYVDEEVNWTPPSSLVQFINLEPAPVFIGFGSMPHHNSKELFDLAVEAARKARSRAIVSLGKNNENGKGRVSEDVYSIDELPHGWLFPRVAAVAHHGGVGTTAESFRAGVPTIIVPHNYDQPFWGQRVASLGMGPEPIQRKYLSADNLAAAITKCLTDTDIKQRASKIGEQVRSEDGVREAVKVIQTELAVSQTHSDGR